MALEKAYKATFGTEASKAQLYRGFWTLILGVGLGVVALILTFVSTGMADEDAKEAFQWRRVAYTLGAVAGPLFFYGMALALPAKQGLRRLSALGAIICLLGALGFGWAYPVHWNVSETTQTDYTVPILGAFALGLLLIVVSTFTGIIGYYLDRISAAQTAAAGGAQSEEMAFGYDVPDAVIERDIEYAMKKYKYAWGEGPQGTTGGMQINIKDEFDSGVVIGGKGIARTVQLDTPQVDEATRVLRGIRPSKDKTMSGEWETDTTKALLAFRKQKLQQEAVKEAVRRRGWWQRFLDWLLGRSPAAAGTPKTTSPAPAPPRETPPVVTAKAQK